MDTLIPVFSRVRPNAPDVAALIDSHFAQMRAQTQPESCHVLDREALSKKNIDVYALRIDNRAVAIGALRVEGAFSEIKSMHVRVEMRGRGYGRRLLEHLLATAQHRGIHRLALETGAGSEHAAARALYQALGFSLCDPFPPYAADPLSVFMDLTL